MAESKKDIAYEDQSERLVTARQAARLLSNDSLTLDEPAEPKHGKINPYEQPLLAALHSGDTDAAISIIKKPNGKQECLKQDRKGWTAVHYAAVYDRAEALRAMAEARVPVDTEDYRGETALHKAAMAWHVASAEALLRAGADPDRRSAKGRTPLFLACMVDWRAEGLAPGPVVDLLCRGRAHLHRGQGWEAERLYAKDNGGRTPIGHLCHNKGKYFDKLPTLLHCRILVYDCAEGMNEIPDSVISHHLGNMRSEMKELCLESHNPLWMALRIAAAMKNRSELSVLSKDDLADFSDYFLHMAKDIMDIHELDIRALVFRVLGLLPKASDQQQQQQQQQEDGAAPADSKGALLTGGGRQALEEGPVAEAIDNGLAEVVALPQFQAAIRHVFWSDLPSFSKDQAGRMSEMLFIPDLRQPFNTPFFFSMYRLYPCLHTFVEFVVFFAAIAITLIIVMSDWDLTATFLIKEIVLITFMCGYLCHELLQLSEGLAAYLGDIWNALDVITIGITFVWFGLKLTGDEDLVRHGYCTLSLNAFFMLFRFLHFAAFYLPSFGPLVLIVLEMVGDVFRFLSLYVVTLWGFSVVFWVQFSHIDNFSNLAESMLYLYGCTMDSFDFTIFDGDAHEWTGNLLLAFYLLLTTIMQINLLIAILADTYSRIQGDSWASWCLMYGDFVKERTITNTWPRVLYVVPPFNLLNAAILPVSRMATSSRAAGVFAYNFIQLHDIFVTVVVMMPAFVVADYLYFLFRQGPIRAMRTAWVARGADLSPPGRALYALAMPLARPLVYAGLFLANCARHAAKYHASEMNAVLPQVRRGYDTVPTGEPEAEEKPLFWLDPNCHVDAMLKQKMCEVIRDMPEELNQDLPEAIGALDSKVTQLDEKVTAIFSLLTGDKKSSLVSKFFGTSSNN